MFREERDVLSHHLNDAGLVSWQIILAIRAVRYKHQQLRGNVKSMPHEQNSKWCDRSILTHETVVTFVSDYNRRNIRDRLVSVVKEKKSPYCRRVKEV